MRKISPTRPTQTARYLAGGQTRPVRGKEFQDIQALVEGWSRVTGGGRARGDLWSACASCGSHDTREVVYNIISLMKIIFHMCNNLHTAA